MTIQEALDRKSLINTDSFPKELKIAWLSELDAQIDIEVIQRHENPEGITFEKYNPDKCGKELLVPFPYDKLYIPFLLAKCAEAYGEIEEYNNYLLSYNSALKEFKAYWNRTYMPLSDSVKREKKTGVMYVYPVESPLEEEK
jgi:hypothetical protein